MTSESVDAWEAQAKREDYQAAVHPTAVDPELYAASGQAEVAQLLALYEKHQQYPRQGVVRRNRVLEFGVGDGRILCEWPESWERWGCDASATMITRFEDRAVALTHRSLNQLGYTTFWWDGLTPRRRASYRFGIQFDLIYAVTVLIHQTQADGIAIVGNLADLVAPGGLLLLGHPLYMEPNDDGSWLGVTTWSVAQLQRCANDCGLDLVEAWQSPGAFAFGALGAFHGATQVLRKPGGAA